MMDECSSCFACRAMNTAFGRYGITGPQGHFHFILKETPWVAVFVLARRPFAVSGWRRRARY